MSSRRDAERLEAILEKIDFILSITSDYQSIVTALEDEKMARPAILMHFVGIAEQFSKIQENSIEKEFTEDIRGAMSIRNFIAHDYDGVNLAIVEKTIRYILPKLKSKIEKILQK